ncbi:hypothetical protein V1508DRAFT_347397 [Lipomyces doorenjongii]|uniref:uncharacterized protein n=1 Tax=Lipomyces doorenjongii TaxID=383834 RepID=UPI0034CD90D9
MLLLALACIARLTASDTIADATDAADLFSGTKCLKVLRLAGDIVVAAASAGIVEISDTVKREEDIKKHALLVTLAKDIANRVNVEDLRQWITGKVCVRLSKKVVEKCVTRHIDVRIVNGILEFFALLQSIVPDINHMENVIEMQIDKALGETSDNVEFQMIADRAWAYVKMCNPPAKFGRYIESAYRLGTHSPEPSVISAQRLKTYQDWIDSIIEVLALPSDDPIQMQYRDLLATYFTHAQAQAYYRGLENSPPAVDSRHFSSSLAEDMTKFKYKLAVLPLFVYASSTTGLSNQLMVREMHTKAFLMMPKVLSLQLSSIPCGAVLAPSISIIEHPATPSLAGSTSTLIDWRARLLSELTQDATRQHESVIAFVAHLCRDLERRCEQVEAPLRQLEAQFSALKNENELLERDLKDSQVVLKEREADIKELNDKFVDLTGDLRDRDERCALLLSDNESLRTELARVVSEAQVRHSRDKSEFQKKLNKEEENHMIKVSDLHDKLDQADAMVRERQLKADKFEAISCELEAENTKARTRISELDKNRSELQMKLDSQEESILDLEKQAELARESISQLQREVEGLHIHNTELIQQLGDQSSRVTELTEAYPAQLAIREQEFRAQMAELEQLHEERNKISQQEHLDALTALKQEISRTKTQADESISELVREVELYQMKLKTLKQQTSTRIKQLKTRIGQMAENEERQNRELARVQSMSKKLIGVMASNIEVAGTPAGPIPSSATNRPPEVEDDDMDYFSLMGSLREPEQIPIMGRKESRKSATTAQSGRVFADTTNRDHEATRRERISLAPGAIINKMVPQSVKQSRRMTVNGDLALTTEMRGSRGNEDETFGNEQSRPGTKFVHLVGADIPSTGSSASSTSSASTSIARTDLEIMDTADRRDLDDFEDEDDNKVRAKNKAGHRSGPMATSTRKGEGMPVDDGHGTLLRPGDQTTYYGSTPDLPHDI